MLPPPQLAFSAKAIPLLLISPSRTHSPQAIARTACSPYIPLALIPPLNLTPPLLPPTHGPQADIRRDPRPTDQAEGGAYDGVSPLGGRGGIALHLQSLQAGPPVQPPPPKRAFCSRLPLSPMGLHLTGHGLVLLLTLLAGYITNFFPFPS